MASLLPVEIIQNIFSHLTPENFDSARLVCQSWRFASFSSHVLRKQLEQIPVKIPKVDESVPQPTVYQLHDAFRQAAFACLFGMRDKITRTSETIKMPNTTGTNVIWAKSGDGKTLASFHSGRLEVFDLTHQTPELVSSRSLYPLWTSVSRAITDGMTSWLSMAPPYATYRLALSSNGEMLAVALARTIQFYDLRPGEEDTDPIELVLNVPVQKPVAAAWTDVKGVIESIDFTDSDRLLRIRVGREGVVKESARIRYYGIPAARPKFEMDREPEELEPPRELFEYWKRAANYVFTDSVALSQTLISGESLYLRGMQLLPWSAPTTVGYQGRMFVALLQCQVQSNYCVGVITRLGEAMILSKLPNRFERLTGDWYKNSPSNPLPWVDPANLIATAAEKLTISIPRWDPCNMPQVTTSKPILATADDGELMAVFEPGAAKQYSFCNGGAIYLYRLSGAMAHPYHSEKQTAQPEGAPSRVQPWSFLLDTISEEILSLKMQRSSEPGASKTYMLEAETSKRRIRWQLGV
ncbi:MAG: hypothetical protein M1834_008156 [Cirrosporium novae-zelandiae]|nr:MAG: hypothetical protein M1834_008156 [Cirrosporium novae-zelandiae]